MPVDEIPCPDGLNVGVMARLGAIVRRLRPEVFHCYNPRPMLYGGTVARLAGVPATLGTLSAFACLTPDTAVPLLAPAAWCRPRGATACATGSRRLAGTRGRDRVAVAGQQLLPLQPHRSRAGCASSPTASTSQRFANVPADRDRRVPQRHRVPPDAIVIGSVGRLVEQKDYPTQLRAFALAAAAIPRLLMLLLGDGPLRGEMEALAASLGVADRVRFAGHSNDVPLALRAMDIFVLASKFEPYGVAILEAKAAGHRHRRDTRQRGPRDPE